ncbi:uncharacterized protein FIBRA_08308 [Fibroporia radiculosa]|uniref:Uncharacterized protein n=1 Tax=Fibroporia radiculosa TaxID=599839 RepID=J4ICA3_9APHY|nr:uncharacterized protein FIBRA_08308 [Fibroporia radiculosa]CCM06061.1 predicted protein [Fibroporia radiculosa]
MSLLKRLSLPREKVSINMFGSSVSGSTYTRIMGMYKGTWLAREPPAHVVRSKTQPPELSEASTSPAPRTIPSIAAVVPTTACTLSFSARAPLAVLVVAGPEVDTPECVLVVADPEVDAPECVLVVAGPEVDALECVLVVVGPEIDVLECVLEGVGREEDAEDATDAMEESADEFAAVTELELELSETVELVVERVELISTVKVNEADTGTDGWFSLRNKAEGAKDVPAAHSDD